MGVNKSKSAFRSIAEVTEDLGIAPHVLRFWETKFTQIKPMKTKSSRRYYRPDDVAILELIKELLYERRYTIEGVQKLFKNRTIKDILGSEIQKDIFADIENLKETSQVSIEETVNNAIIGLTKIKEDLKNLISN
ncbi:MAG: MerR family transcriptional regulator [Alphaproteobacteria bacterium]|nr:MerR family transcriptional regulator [Alphaproteobacteria bacterium]